MSAAMGQQEVGIGSELARSTDKRWLAFGASLAIFLLGHSIFLGLAVALAGSH